MWQSSVHIDTYSGAGIGIVQKGEANVQRSLCNLCRVAVKLFGMQNKRKGETEKE